MPKMHSRAAAVAAALFVCAAGLGARPAYAAAQFSVEPLLLNLPAEKLATSLTLGNKGAAPVTVQSELIAWTQDGGEDAYSPAAGMVVSPPIFKLAPGATQVVRVGRLKRGSAQEREQAFRIKLTEVPAQESAKVEAVSTLMQLSLPVFVPPADRKARAAVEFKAAAQANRDLRFSIANPGLIHDKVTRLVALQDGKVIAERSLNYYVLAGARRELVWPAALKNAKAGPVEIKVQLEGKSRVLAQVLASEAQPAARPPVPEAKEKN